MTEMFVHGVGQVAGDGMEFVILTTPVAIDGDTVREFMHDEDRPEIHPDVHLYKLTDLGLLADWDEED